MAPLPQESSGEWSAERWLALAQELAAASCQVVKDPIVARVLDTARECALRERRAHFAGPIVGPL